MDFVTVGQYLKEFRIKNGYTQQEFADILEKSKSTIQKYEKGLIEIPDKTFRQIKDIFGIYIPDELHALNNMINEDDDFISLSYNLRQLERRQRLLKSYYQLNDKGQELAVEQVELVTKVPEYRADQDHEDKEKGPVTDPH